MSDITMMPVSTAVNFNDGASGGSVTSELCVKAAIDASQQITSILAPFKTKNPTFTFAQLCAAAIGTGLDVRAIGRAKLPSPSTPDSYQTFGAVILESYLDVLTGISFRLSLSFYHFFKKERTRFFEVIF